MGVIGGGSEVHEYILMPGGRYFGDEQIAPARASFTCSRLAGADLCGVRFAAFRTAHGRTVASGQWLVEKKRGTGNGIRGTAGGIGDSRFNIQERVADKAFLSLGLSARGSRPNLLQLSGRVFQRPTLRDGSGREDDGVLHLPLPPPRYSPTFGVPGSPTPSPGRRPPVHARSTRGWSRQLPRGSTYRERLP